MSSSSSSSANHILSLIHRHQRPEDADVSPENIFKLAGVPVKNAELAQVSTQRYERHINGMIKNMNQLLSVRDEERKSLVFDTATRGNLLEDILKAETARTVALQDISVYAHDLLEARNRYMNLFHHAEQALALKMNQIDTFVERLNRLNEIREKGIVMNIGYNVPATRMNALLGSEIANTAIVISKQTKKDVLAYIQTKYKETDYGKQFNIAGGSDVKWDWYQVIVDRLEHDIQNHGIDVRDSTDWRQVYLYFKYHDDELPGDILLKQQLNPLWSFSEIAQNRHAYEVEQRRLIQENKLKKQQQAEQQVNGTTQ